MPPLFDWSREIPEWRPVLMTGALVLSSAAFFAAGLVVGTWVGC
jgi:hypothetical protein